MTYLDEVLETPKHYDNTNGSLYQFAEKQGLNAWEYDILKHLVRCRKKGEWISDINKCIKILELYKQEQEHLYNTEVEPLNK